MQIAITGGVAEGKSTVLRFLAEAGYSVASADQLARRVFEQETVQKQVSQLLKIPTPLDRAAVASLVYADATARREVNKLMHPLVLEQLRVSGAQFVEVPLLVETCLLEHFTRIWVVTCGEREQLKRLTERVGDRFKARALIATQLATCVKSAFADLEVRTNVPFQNVQSFVTEQAELALRQAAVN